MMDIQNKHIVVAGAARSGIAVALLLKQHGAHPFVTDTGEICASDRDKLSKNDIQFEQGGHTEKATLGEHLVVSPGVPTKAGIVQKYLAAGKPVYSEIEAASWFCKSRIVAVTGSNGKTTVVNWLQHLWNTANRASILAGNVGTAFSGIVDKTAPDTDALLEVSSFQLDHIDTFKPTVSILLNLTPDHLDRYDHSFEKYAQSKFRIAENQDSADTFIYDLDDPVVSDFATIRIKESPAPAAMAFSCLKKVDNGAFLQDGNIVLKLNNKEEFLMNVGEISLKGRHNLKNGMATALAARALEIKNEYIRESLRTFEGVAHRLESVRKYEGVAYVNDSKATNVNAVWYALDSFEIPIVLILGGRDKGNDYRQLEKQLHEKVHTIITLGEASEKIEQQLTGVVPHIIHAISMKDAVKKARKAAKRGETVLLSPACSSFDMFDSYEDRGHQFKQAVIEL